MPTNSSTFPYGVPPGGLTGQTLTKLSNADSICGWSSAGGASGAWPVGSVFISVLRVHPSTSLGFGTWVLLGRGRFTVEIGAEPQEILVYLWERTA